MPGLRPRWDSSLTARRPAGRSDDDLHTRSVCREQRHGASDARTRRSQTSLGNVSTWPQNLRSAVAICVESRLPIAIYWGTDATLLYNDTWSPILGAKHPWALGCPAADVWPEIWDEIGPLFDRVFSTGDATDAEDAPLVLRRRGSTEESCFNCTFSQFVTSRAGSRASSASSSKPRTASSRRGELHCCGNLASDSADRQHDPRRASGRRLGRSGGADIAPRCEPYVRRGARHGTSSVERSVRTRSIWLTSCRRCRSGDVSAGPDLVFEFAHPLAVKASGGRQLEGRTVLDAFPEYRGQPFIEMLQHVYRTGEIISLHETCARVDGPVSGSIGETYWNSMYLPGTDRTRRDRWRDDV